MPVLPSKRDAILLVHANTVAHAIDESGRARSDLLLNFRYQSYSVLPDSQRSLAIRRAPGSVPRQLNVILDWSAELDRLAPDGRRDEGVSDRVTIVNPLPAP